MKSCSFLSWLSHFPIQRFAIVTLIALVCSTPAFCGKIHDETEADDMVRVRALLKKNPNLVHSKDNNDFTPLHMAARNGDKDMVELFLAKKANVNAKDRCDSTPLHVAAEFGHKDVAVLLLAGKADVNAKDNNGETPLHLAAGLGHKDVVELLLAGKANVNAKNSAGETPLSVAAELGYKDVVELLRKHGGHK